jgi:hypothetical protein
MNANSRIQKLTVRRQTRIRQSAILFLPLLFVFCQEKRPGKPIGSTYLELAKPEVWRVPANSPAQIIGLKPGDLIISYNDEVVQSFKSLQQIERRIKNQTGKVKLTILRDEQELIVEIDPVPLGFIPKSKRFSASLAKAIEDIMQHFGLPAYYDWLAAMTTESFGLTLRAGDCSSWGTGGRAYAYLPNLSRWTGLSFKLLWSNGESLDQSKLTPIYAVRQGLHQANRDGGSVLLIYGKWNGKRAQWGIPVRLVTKEESLPRVYGWTVESDGEPVECEEIFAVYEVRFRGGVNSEPARLVSGVLDQALEIGLATADTGWHSGLEAYDLLLKELERFPICPDGPGAGDEYFYQLVYNLISSKESANQFFEDMKQALPEQAGLLDEVMGRNRVIIARLEGIVARRLSLNSWENQQKVARVLVEIEEIENELLGFYEELIGEL